MTTAREERRRGKEKKAIAKLTASWFQGFKRAVHKPDSLTEHIYLRCPKFHAKILIKFVEANKIPETDVQYQCEKKEVGK